MRKLIFGINMTLDGCVDHTKGDANDDVHDYFTELMRGVDTLVYGRKTYELMFPFWSDVAKNHSGPTQAINEFAEVFSAIDKIIIFSKTLEKAPSENTSIVHSNLKDTILKLKQEPGKNISTGGVDVPSQLIALDLVDEYHFVVHPIVAGEGRRLMEGISLPERLRLKLVESKIFDSGHVAMRYVK